MKYFIKNFLLLNLIFALTSNLLSKELIIPKIKNKEAITVVVEKGHWTKYLKENLAPRFTNLTKVPVNIVEVSLGNMHDMQNLSLQNATGEFDVLSLEAGWAKEWAAKGYTIPLNELAQQFDKQKSNWKKYLDSFYPSLFEILSYNNELHSIPYNTYVMANHYRLDLFEHKTEQKNFKKRYGYKLNPPRTLGQLKDVAEFFTRKKGSLLKNQKLEKDFYGVALMSGNKPHINDEWSAILWALGGTWFNPHYSNNELTHFSLPTNTSLLQQTAHYYLELKQYAYPANKDFAYYESAQALASGNVAMWPFAYNNLWSISSKKNKNDDSQRFAISQTPGEKPYHGAYAFAVAYDSNNPEAAFWFLRFMTSKKGQVEYAKGGGNPTRADVNKFLSLQIERKSPQCYSLKATSKANAFWNNRIKHYGHYSSTAMGMIYPLLTHYSYLISSKQIEVNKGIEELLKKIRDAQNMYGEKAMFGQ